MVMLVKRTRNAGPPLVDAGRKALERSQQLYPVAPRRLAALAIVAAGWVSVIGCQASSEPQVASGPRIGDRDVEPAPYLTLDGLTRVVAGDGGVTLVEFCVPTGCVRCDQMRDSIERIASERIAVRRFDLSRHPALAWEFGVTVCPSYVAFRDGREVFRAAHPTSADLIASGLEEALRGPAADQVSLVVH
ncbi:MAG: thioredoxin family protein [Planctomycetota bacterium]